MFGKKDFHYLKEKHIGESLQDVNDTAENCVKLIQDFNDNKRRKTKIVLTPGRSPCSARPRDGPVYHMYVKKVSVQ